jgi:hypothetical protein
VFFRDTRRTPAFRSAYPWGGGNRERIYYLNLETLKSSITSTQTKPIHPRNDKSWKRAGKRTGTGN